MFVSEKRRSFQTFCKGTIALPVLSIWLVSMSYCGLTSIFPCKSDAAHETKCHHNSEDSDSDSHSHSSKNETCCESVKTLVLPASSVVVQPPPPPSLLWILSEPNLLHNIGLGQASGFYINDHGPPGSLLILFSLHYLLLLKE